MITHHPCPENRVLLHERVNGEWSFIQTLRHSCS
jgi:hypothetical protein